MRWTIFAAGILTSVVVPGLTAVPAAAQSRVVVPIVIQAPRPGTTSPSRTPTIHVTTRTASPQPGVTATRVTVRDTTGGARTAGMSSGVKTLGSVAPPGTPSVLVTVDRRREPDGRGAPGQTKIIVEDVSRSSHTVGGPAPVSVNRTASPGQQTLIITSEAPIDAPIVILGP
jgi:hypothetical protein